MDTTFPVSRPASIPSPARLTPLAKLAQRLGNLFTSMNVRLGRKTTTIVPGMSDRAIARLAQGEHYEDSIRRNALAHQYGGMRTNG